MEKPDYNKEEKAFDNNSNYFCISPHPRFLFAHAFVGKEKFSILDTCQQLTMIISAGTFTSFASPFISLFPFFKNVFNRQHVFNNQKNPNNVYPT